MTFLVRDKRNEALQRDGLVIRSTKGDITLKVKTVTNGGGDGPYDVVLLTCKAYDLDSAMDAIAPAIGADTTIVPLLNGTRHLEALDARLPRLGVQNLLLQANRQARFGGLFDPCNEAAFNGRGIEPLHWCFDDADTGTVGGDQGSGNVEWMPQGVTTVADAQADERWGDRQAVLVSWYDKRLGDEKGVRVSFLDPETGLYQHVLLVYPYVAENEDPTYEILQTPQNGDRPRIHAGGIAWYGNYLYVADTVRGIRVFDMRYIFDLETAGNGNTTDRHQIGLHGGNYYGFGYRYVMPQVDLWVLWSLAILFGALMSQTVGIGRKRAASGLLAFVAITAVLRAVPTLIAGVFMGAM